MFSQLSLEQIRDMEAFLYGGPETVEQIYESSDNFQAIHVRKREPNGVESSKLFTEEVWYRYKFDEDKGDFIYELPQE